MAFFGQSKGDESDVRSCHLMQFRPVDARLVRMKSLLLSQFVLVGAQTCPHERAKLGTGDTNCAKGRFRGMPAGSAC